MFYIKSLVPLQVETHVPSKSKCLISGHVSTHTPSKFFEREPVHWLTQIPAESKGLALPTHVLTHTPSKYFEREPVH